MKDQTKAAGFDVEYFERRRHPIGRLIFWIKSKLIQDVPGTVAQCEFDCRRYDCTRESSENCKDRIEVSSR